MPPHQHAPTRAQQPLLHAERLAFWHQPVRIRRRRPWWPRVAATLLVCAALAGGLAVMPGVPDATVTRVAR